MTDVLAITRSEHTGEIVPWIPESKFALLRDTYAKGATPQEFELFVAVCNRLRLDPFARQIYAVKRWNSQLRREEMTPQVSIDGMRLAAERTGKYAGQGPPEWCGADGKWVDVWLSHQPPMAARVAVYRHGFAQPITANALYSEYVQKTKEGNPTRFWATMPANQLAKCAESLALRKAFPNELSGVYTVDEMGQSDNDRPQLPATTAPKEERKSTPPPAEEGPTFSRKFPDKRWAGKPLSAATGEILSDYAAWLESMLQDPKQAAVHTLAQKALDDTAAALDAILASEAAKATDPIADGLQKVIDERGREPAEGQPDGWGLEAQP